jgi:hypothetical protein
MLASDNPWNPAVQFRQRMSVMDRAISSAHELCSIHCVGRFAKECERIQETIAVIVQFLETLHQDSKLANESAHAVGDTLLALQSAKDAIITLNRVDSSSTNTSEESATKLVDDVVDRFGLVLNKVDVIGNFGDQLLNFK